MEIRRCGHTHFIQTISGGLEIKVHNTNSHGRPALSFKNLKDVCERIDVKTLQQPRTVNSRNTQTGLAMVDRSSWEVKTETDELVPHPNGLDNDLDDMTTLRHLKDSFLKNKRRFSHDDENPVKDKSHLDLPMVDRTLREVKLEKDESDNGLDSDSDDATTLTQLKERSIEKKRKLGGGEEHTTLACSNESSIEDESNLNEPIINLKSKNLRRVKGGVDSSSTIAFNVKCEVNLVSEGSQQVGSNLGPVICVKVEDDSSFCNNEVPCPGGEVSNGIEFRKSIFSAEEYGNCVTNEISYDHLDGIEPISVSVPSDGTVGKLEIPELRCHEVLEEISEQSNSSGVQDLAMASTDCTIRCIGLCDGSDIVQLEDNFKEDNSLISPDKNCSSSQDSIISSKTDSNLVPMIIPDAEHPVLRSLDDLTENGLNCGTNINEGLFKTEERASLKKQSFGCADTVSTTEPCRPPERLLSTRKVISPSSQEQLCSVMNSAEPFNDINQYEGETGKKASSARSEIQHAKIAVVSQRKVYISSRHIIKKSQDAKFNLEGPRFTRVLPNLSTECTSIQGCSESAIAFSQRQMQDMESLAFKLMDELESMKGIVEQKLLFEAHRNVSLKNAVPRENRKIVFADETGGKLCHVKFFEAVVTPPVSDGVIQ
ncbi:hypothetical protein PHJA_002322500 [Phtheirospermum japonicum]|uniref:Uncharacterized protein n=1 Tax=Phtheirospermum japonicum TaxID=374723 RepID=A0A830D3N1_9LAMI|nr:hypothetical protein PHJA_002322500 [Phtheirospermum japonicum]